MRSLADCDVYVLRDPAGVVRRVLRAHSPAKAAARRPAGWSLESVYSSQIPAEVVVMQRALCRWLGLGERPGAGNWPAHVDLPTRADLLAAERRLGVDAGLERRAGRRSRGI